jgi:hypothetical protein
MEKEEWNGETDDRGLDAETVKRLFVHLPALLGIVGDKEDVLAYAGSAQTP